MQSSLETGTESTKKAGGNKSIEDDAPRSPKKPGPPHKRKSPPKAALINYEVLRYESISEALLSQCATLFGDHYGVWGANGRKPGERVKLGPRRLKSQCLFDKNCFVVLARKQNGELVGHAFVCRFPWGDGFASWITQLVVSTDERGQGIASSLCNYAYDPHDLASGLASSHPFAVRALERARGSRCSPSLIAKHAAGFIASSGIPYVRDCPLRLSDEGSIIDTKFFVDHTEANALLAKEEHWQMGPLNDGEEYYAFIFTGVK